MSIKKKYKLNVKWNTRFEDVMVEYPLGIQTKADGSLILSKLTREFAMELQSRGYDIHTLKFSIEVDFNNPKTAEKFPTLAADFKE